MISDIELLVSKTDILPIMVTDIKDSATKERLVKLTDDRVM